MRTLATILLLMGQARADNLDGLSSEAIALGKDPANDSTAFLVAYRSVSSPGYELHIESQKAGNTAGCAAGGVVLPAPLGATDLSHPSLTTTSPQGIATSWLAVSARVNGAWGVYVTHRVPNAGDGCTGWTSGWTALPLPPGWGNAASAPAIVEWRDTGFVYLFLRDGENFLDYTWFDATHGSWTSWNFNPVGGVLFSQPGVHFYYTNNRVHVFYTDAAHANIGHLEGYVRIDGSLGWALSDSRPMPSGDREAACAVGGTSAKGGQLMYLSCNYQVASYVPGATSWSAVPLSWSLHGASGERVSEPMFGYLHHWDSYATSGPPDPNLLLGINVVGGDQRFMTGFETPPALGGDGLFGLFLCPFGSACAYLP